MKLILHAVILGLSAIVNFFLHSVIYRLQLLLKLITVPLTDTLYF